MNINDQRMGASTSWADTSRPGSPGSEQDNVDSQLVDSQLDGTTESKSGLKKHIPGAHPISLPRIWQTENGNLALKGKSI